MTYADPQLTPGTRIRSRRHPQLHGKIDGIEYAKPGCVAGIPYRVRWDDADRAYNALGMLCSYQTDAGIEALPLWAEHAVRRISQGRHRRVGLQRIAPPAPTPEYAADVLRGWRAQGARP